MTPLPDVKDEALRVLQAASDEKIVLRLIGGVAIAMRCPSASKDLLQRNYADMDVVGHERQSKAINAFFPKMGYEPRVRFNAMMGRKRLIFNDMTNQRRVDVFLDVFEMSHKFNFSERVGLEPITLPLADLLATKLQIVQINEKDFKDVAALLLDHDVGTADGEVINGAYLAKLCSNDWGVYKTLTMNIAKLENSVDVLGLPPGDIETVNARARKLADMIEAQPKTLAWKMRARVGESKQWYELPEADKPFVVDP